MYAALSRMSREMYYSLRFEERYPSFMALQ
jgi:hypothetical protein